VVTGAIDGEEIGGVQLANYFDIPGMAGILCDEPDEVRGAIEAIALHYHWLSRAESLGKGKAEDNPGLLIVDCSYGTLDARIIGGSAIDVCHGEGGQITAQYRREAVRHESK
jgi:hypothetical protein